MNTKPTTTRVAVLEQDPRRITGSGCCWSPTQMPPSGQRILRQLPGRQSPSSTAAAFTAQPLPPSRLSPTEGHKSTNSRGNKKSLPQDESKSVVQSMLQGSPWEQGPGGTPAQIPSRTALASSLLLAPEGSPSINHKPPMPSPPSR